LRNRRVEVSSHSFSRHPKVRHFEARLRETDRAGFRAVRHFLTSGPKSERNRNFNYTMPNERHVPVEELRRVVPVLPAVSRRKRSIEAQRSELPATACGRGEWLRLRRSADKREIMTEKPVVRTASVRHRSACLYRGWINRSPIIAQIARKANPIAACTSCSGMVELSHGSMCHLPWNRIPESSPLSTWAAFHASIYESVYRAAALESQSTGCGQRIDRAGLRNPQC